ncbi:hypothetical protein FWF64_01655 [Candidatus Saccharibacteria bacterium]|nr:hypothetical protein [Candidatus Saccharibacteria bacterium]
MANNLFDDETIKSGLAKAQKDIEDPAFWNEFKATPKDDLWNYHFTLGLYIRNNFNKNGWVDDDMSGEIMEKWHDILNEDDFNKTVMPVIEAYINKFGDALPIDFDLQLDDPDDNDEWVRVIQKAINDDKPFEDEGIFDE